MECTPPMDGLARTSPQVARIISPPVADTTWPQAGQVPTRRRRHSLPQPVVPDTPIEETRTSNKPNLPQHMDLDSSTHKTLSNPIKVNPTVHKQQHTVMTTQSAWNSMQQQQSRTCLNGVNMDLDFDPPTSQPINFGGGAGFGGSSFEHGIPIVRPPQLTLHSPTSDSRSKGSPPFLGKSHLSSLASRKAARQHHFHERRGPQLHRIQLGKRHIADLDNEDDDDDDDYYSSSGPACKQFINEERMAARMNNLNISSGNSTQGSTFSSFWQAAPAHNSPRFEWQGSRKLPSFAELESRLSDSDPSEDENELRIEYAPELRKALRKRDSPLPEALAKQINPNCMQIVLWQPPGAILEETIKDNSPQTVTKDGNPPSNSPAAGEASMECATEPLNRLSPPGGALLLGIKVQPWCKGVCPPVQIGELMCNCLMP
ncbi:uncharacterized protein [Amphiura filiformis]|uniref:uncharacterized protein isoform X2 n=1 Tax=Amphiura filiformis TaxID=82378 RepID=UPI003B22407E